MSLRSFFAALVACIVMLDWASTAMATSWWQPTTEDIFHIQFSGQFRVPRQPIGIYDLDLFDTPTETIALLHARGARVICYINAGTHEDWRPDAGEFTSTILGDPLLEWPGEKWLDIRSENVRTIMAARILLAAEKKCDGVDFDNLDSYKATTGFALTSKDALEYDRWLAATAHALNMSAGAKNDPDNATELVGFFDWIIAESCVTQSNWCEKLLPFRTAGKPVYILEYRENGITFGKFCRMIQSYSFQGIWKHRELNRWERRCAKKSTE